MISNITQYRYIETMCYYTQFCVESGEVVRTKRRSAKFSPHYTIDLGLTYLSLFLH